MLKIDSHNYNLRQVNLHSKVWLANLSLQKVVFDETIRNGLRHVEEGKIMNIQGVAFSRSFSTPHHTPKVVYVYTQKNIIAQKVIALIQESLFALTNGGAGITKMVGAPRPDCHTNYILDSTTALFEYSSQANIEVNFYRE